MFMKITLIVIGKTDRSYLKDGCEIYMSRLGHYVTFRYVEIPDIKGASSLSREQIKEKEADLILKMIRPSDELVLLDERGRERSSEEWAHHLEERFSRDPRDMVFVIGGPYGFSKRIYDAAGSMISLSRMTFSHQMVRLIFLEQLYRAFTIMRGEPYHHS